MSENTWGRLRVAQRLLGGVSWALLLLGLPAIAIVEYVAHHKEPALLLTMLSIFFGLLLIRLLLKAILSPGRRGALFALLAAIAFWSLGSVRVNALRVEDSAVFPAPGEWLFLVSYLGMAAYLLRDVDLRPARPLRAVLDVAATCGGSACLAALLLVAPIRMGSGLDGSALMLALIYPLADLALALTALSQSLLSTRTDRVKSLMLIVAFVMFAVADSAIALSGSGATYEFGIVRNALWGGAFALLVAAACRPKQNVISAVPREAGGVVLVSAALAALAVLTFRPDETLAYYTVPPALLTLVAVAARMALALREAQQASEALELSMTDDLTKLPNRRALRGWLADSVQERRPLGLMLLDLDGFKDVNDSLGHRAGDTVLRLVAVRIREALDDRVRIARLGGDEFAIVFDTTDEIELMEQGRHLLSELRKPIGVESIEIHPSASIGVAVTDGGELDGSEVMRRADVSMYQAKNAGLGVALYDADLDEFSRSRLQLAEELRRGIAEGQIEVWYQPQFDAATMEVASLEALVRWRHPSQGLLSPVSFLPAARRAGLMEALSVAVVHQAARDHYYRRRDGVNLTVAINCAPPELLGPGLLPELYASIQKWAIGPDALVLEITEDSFLVDPQRTQTVLTALREHGVQVSIDDYGIGFSSLTYLRNLPVQELKMDRSLVANVASDERSRMIVSSTIQLAHALDMRVVAEGVENAADLACLIDIGVDMVQGYHLARPMPASQLHTWLASWVPPSVAHAHSSSTLSGHPPMKEGRS